MSVIAEKIFLASPEMTWFEDSITGSSVFIMELLYFYSRKVKVPDKSFKTMGYISLVEGL